MPGLIAFLALTTLVLSGLSLRLERAGVPALVIALALGALAGPWAIGVVDVHELGLDPAPLFLEVARLTLTITLVGVALRVPHGYWRRGLGWLVAIILIGMPVMLAVAAGATLLLGVSALTALLIGAAITPTDPVVSTPIVTGELSEERIPRRVRMDISSESGVNDGLGYLFLMLPILLLTEPAGTAVGVWLSKILLWEVLVPVIVGAVVGFGAGALLDRAVVRGWTSSSSCLAYGLALAFGILGILRALETDAILGVFVAGAVFGARLTEDLRESLGRQFDALSRAVVLPVFALLGVALPFGEWAELGAAPAAVLALAVIGRRVVAVWATRPIYAHRHDLRETAFLSWFGPVGVSALFYACLAEKETGNTTVFPAVTLAITLSVLLHGLTATPAGLLLHRGRT